MRSIIELEETTGLEEVKFEAPVRLVFMSPRRGGPLLSQIRTGLMGKGRARFSGIGARIFVDVDPGEAEAPVIALDTIARSDADGLERLVLSALPYVDEIVLGVDGRSDDETKEVARLYADTFFVFNATDIGLSAEEWASDQIHFANARNLGRSRVKAPWTLVADTDEFIQEAEDNLREKLRCSNSAEGCETKLVVGGMSYDDHQRLARTHLRWESRSHNQLYHGGVDIVTQLVTVEDKTLRAKTEEARRCAQRDQGIEALVGAAAQGDLSALFHLAKHRTQHTEDLSIAARMIEDYRSRIFPHTVLRDERAWLALAMSYRYYQVDDLAEADRWACRALLDGPRQAVFCMLGDIAEARGDLQDAVGWYECACSISEQPKISWPGLTDTRFNRLAGIKRALIDPANAPTIDVALGPDAS